MSRIGKKVILIPEGVEIKVQDNFVTVKGPKGELSYKVRPEFDIKIQEKEIAIFPNRKTKNTSAFWGLARAIIANMAHGVSIGFEKKLSIEGVGYKANITEGTVVLEMGFSHPVNIKIPEDINCEIQKNIISIKGINKERVGQFAAIIRRVRPPEVYKGKGIRYLGEVVRRKAGKKVVAAK